MLCTNNFWSKGLLTYKWGSTKIGWWPGPCPSVHRSSLPPPLLTYQGKAWWNLFKCTIYNYQMEKAMAPHSSTLAWTIPWTKEPGGLQYMGSQRVRHDWATSLSLFTFMHWRMKWQPTPVFLPGESQGRRSLVGCRLWSHTELDTTEAT